MNDHSMTNTDLTTVVSSSLELSSSSSYPCSNHTDVTYSKEFNIGLILAISSSAFIGTSFIVKKKGLLRLVCACMHLCVCVCVCVCALVGASVTANVF